MWSATSDETRPFSGLCLINDITAELPSGREPFRFPDLPSTFDYLWSRGVTRWFRCSLSVADPFVCRCLTSRTLLPSSHPAHRTGRAERPHPALGERITMSPAGSYSSV